MKYDLKTLEEKDLAFEASGGGNGWQGFNLEFEDEEEFAKHYQAYHDRPLDTTWVVTMSLYESEDGEFCINIETLGQIEHESIVYKYSKQIFCEEW